MRRLLLTLLIILPMTGWPRPVLGVMRAFPAGSLVLPVDPCRQPVSERALATGCDAGGSEAGAAGVYGLTYRLQRAGIPVYQADGPAAGAPDGITLVINGEGHAPVAIQPGGSIIDPPARTTPSGGLNAHLVEYRDAPFLVDVRDLDPHAEAVLAGYPAVRRHQVLVPFSAPVVRVLSGLPTVIVASDLVAAANLGATLALAGMTGAGGLAVAMADPQAAVVDGRALSGCLAGSPPEPFQGTCGLPALFADLAAVPSTIAPREFVTTAPVVDDGVLYAASATIPGPAGHLRAFALDDSRQTRLWDAAEGIPPPGAGLPPPVSPDWSALAPPFSVDPAQRVLFTNLDAAQGFRLVTFDAPAAALLQPLLGAASSETAAALINALRGRLGTAAAAPAGTGDRPIRLGGISRSSPAVVGGSLFDAAAAQRDQVLYAGAEDGLLHAILAGRRIPAEGHYDHEAATGYGRELWAYLPGSLLPHLADQPVDRPGQLPAVHVDGAPVVGDLFIDGDGDGFREWRTVLVGTASAQTVNRGVVFALDVTDPYAPRLLWETALAEIGLGRSRGAALSRSGGWSSLSPRVLVTAATATRLGTDNAPDPVNGRYGALACALDLVSGTLLWRFAVPYEGVAANLADAPTAPTLMQGAASGGIDGLVFGDLAGRLWALDPESGAPLNGGPVWQSPGAVSEPIGGGIAVHNRLALFGSGGVEHTGGDRNFAVYAVEILPEGGRLLWSQPLAPGEKLWGAPGLDRFGRAYFGLGGNLDTVGRLLVIAADGTLSGSVALAGAPCGGVALTAGSIVTVSRTGQVEQIGEFRGDADRNGPGRVRVFSWRVR